MSTTTESRTSIASHAFSRWLQCGLALMLVFPPLRGFDPQFGWWPMWLVLLPLACLLLLRPRLLGLVARSGRRRWTAERPLARQAVRYRRAVPAVSR